MPDILYGRLRGNMVDEFAIDGNIGSIIAGVKTMGIFADERCVIHLSLKPLKNLSGAAARAGLVATDFNNRFF